MPESLESGLLETLQPLLQNGLAQHNIRLSDEGERYCVLLRGGATSHQ